MKLEPLTVLKWRCWLTSTLWQSSQNCEWRGFSQRATNFRKMYHVEEKAASGYVQTRLTSCKSRSNVSLCTDFVEILHGNASFQSETVTGSRRRVEETLVSIDNIISIVVRNPLLLFGVSTAAFHEKFLDLKGRTQKRSPMSS